MSRRAFSRDARRASSVLAIMLSKVPRPVVTSEATPQRSNATQASTNGTAQSEAAASYSGSTPWSINGFDLADQELPTQHCAPPDFSSSDPLNAVFSEFDNID